MRWSFALLAAAAMGFASPAAGDAQTVSGQARAVQATVFNPLGASTTVLADTGTLANASDARDASSGTGSIPALMSGEALHAATIGWADQVASEASVADLALTVAGLNIGAEFVMARARALLGTAGTGTVNIDGLSINGVPVAVTGDPNQTIALPGGRLVINEQLTSAGSTVVNALHVVAGGADVVIASATAGIR